MIAVCTHCGQPIRDCTMFEFIAFSHISRPVIGWYHTADGHERCQDMSTLAEPRPLVAVSCPQHPRGYDQLCRLCQAVMQVSLSFHNQERCIPAFCGWPHVH